MNGVEILVICIIILLLYSAIAKAIQFQVIILDIKRLRNCAIASSAFLCIAHMVSWTNAMLLYDNAYLYRGNNGFSIITSDRWLSWIINYFDRGHNLPWLSGALSVLFMIVAVYCLSEVIRITGGIFIWMLAGVCSTNTSIISLQQECGKILLL